MAGKMFAPRVGEGRTACEAERVAFVLSGFSLSGFRGFTRVTLLDLSGSSLAS